MTNTATPSGSGWLDAVTALHDEYRRTDEYRTMIRSSSAERFRPGDAVTAPAICRCKYADPAPRRAGRIAELVEYPGPDVYIGDPPHYLVEFTDVCAGHTGGSPLVYAEEELARQDEVRSS